MAKPKQKEGEFDETLVGALCDELRSHSHALKALGELICSSSFFSGFADDSSGEGESANLRWGLQQMIDLYLDRQEKILDEYKEKYECFDLVLLKKGENTLKIVEEGAFVGKEAAHDALRRAVSFLDVVMERENEYKEKAGVIKGKCEAYLNGEGGKAGH